MKKKIFLLGSTGSIGQSTIDVVRQHTDRFEVGTLVTNRNVDLLAKQIDQVNPEYVVIYDPEACEKFTGICDRPGLKILQGREGILEILQSRSYDIFLNAFVGFAGLEPTIRAIEQGVDIAIANKETLVVAGQLVVEMAQKKGVRLLPIDSEHSAIWQCLVGEDQKNIKRLIITASGGPFRTRNQAELAHVTPAEALKHPNWDMGAKITIDSATLMNKGLEVIEAFWLYGLPIEKINVLVHPQSIIHSMVEFIDHSVKAQLGIPDMRIPIQYALTYPERLPLNVPQADFLKINRLDFEPPDMEKFPCLRLAFEAIGEGKTYPAAMNAANEIAVEAFLNNLIKFNAIPEIIEEILTKHSPSVPDKLDDYLAVDASSRQQAKDLINLKQFKR